ncbi:hypothetical protein pipiens_017944 [Culex pipiens pipiens]|uniref:Uncharacterized protein n=1 Tax=Culex pipiens pipiens TaxID=38569 RepID=A0ABD1CE76_CULPP
MLSHSSSSSDRHPHSGASSQRESTSNVTKDKEVSGNVMSVPAPMVPPVAAKIEIEENVPEAAVDVVVKTGYCDVGTLLLLLMGFGEGFDAGVGQVGGNGGRGGIGGSGGGCWAYSSDAGGNENSVFSKLSALLMFIHKSSSNTWRRSESFQLSRSKSGHSTVPSRDQLVHSVTNHIGFTGSRSVM